MRTDRKRWALSRVLRWGVGVGIVAAIWHVSAVSLAGGALDLFVFTAPGALSGLAVGWLSFAAVRREFTWQTGLYSALAGSVILPPWLSALIAISGLTSAGAVFVLVAGAWLAVAVGAMLALLRGANRLIGRRHAQAMRARRHRRVR